MKILNEYPGSHHYIETYEKNELHCPSCGEQSVWNATSGGDYYVGEQYLCTACSASFTIQGPYTVRDVNEFGILQQLRSGITLEPTTKKGG